MKALNQGPDIEEREGMRDETREGSSGKSLEAYFNKTFKSASIICGAMMASLLIYAVAVEIFRARFEGYFGLARFEDIRMLRYLFYMIGALEIIVIRIVRGLVLRKKIADDSRSLIQKLMRTSLISVSLSEVPALLGLVLFFLTGQTRDFFILLTVSFLLIFMFFPRRRNWEEWSQL